MWKKLRRKLKIALLLITILLVAAGCVLGLDAPRELYESHSPTGIGTVVFISTPEWKDSLTTDCYAVEHNGRFWIYIKFDSHNNSSNLDLVTWSRDGTVVAIRGTKYLGSAKYGPFFTGAYDFKQHRAFSFGKVRPVSKRIKQLLWQRGGERKARLTDVRPLTQIEEGRYERE